MKRSLPALLFLALFALPAQADVYKCRLPNGQTEISNAPCASGSGTLKVRPDDTVPEQNRQQAEREAARMREYVEKREAAKRLDEQAERKEEATRRQSAATRDVYDSANMEDCLAALARHSPGAERQAELEAICRAKPKSEAPAAPPQQIIVPVYPPSHLHDRVRPRPPVKYDPPTPPAKPGARPETLPEYRPNTPCLPGNNKCVR